MPHWSKNWKRIEEQLSKRPSVLLACDFDATAAPRVAHPDEAQLPDEMRSLLRQLATRGGVTLAVISGRSLADVRKRVGIEGIFYCGNHGLEIEGPGFGWSSADAHVHRPVVARALADLRRQMDGIEGVIFEDNGLTAAIHWRTVSNTDRDGLRELVVAAVESHPELRLAHGNAVWGVRPRVDWNRGAAIRYLLTRAELTTADVICLGDDTDESAFRAFPDGVTVCIGSSTTTAARYRLNDGAASAALLFCLLGARLSTRTVSVRTD